MWWNAVVHIDAGISSGTGVLISPQLVVTAAHVLTPVGNSAPATSAIQVTRMFGNVAKLTARAARVTPEWQSSAPTPELHDLALIAVHEASPTHLVPEPSLTTMGAPFDGASYGFIPGPLGRMFRGKVVSDGRALSSPSILPELGMSGGPVLFDMDPNPTETFRLVGITRARPANGGPLENIGLLLRADVLLDLSHGL